MLNDLNRAHYALYSIPADLPRDDWVKAGMAAHAAGIDFDAFDAWSAGAGNYDAAAARDTWRSFKPGKGVGLEPCSSWPLTTAGAWMKASPSDRPPQPPGRPQSRRASQPQA